MFARPSRDGRRDSHAYPTRLPLLGGRPFSSASRALDSATLHEPGAPPPLNVANVPLISPHLQAQLFPPPDSPFAPPPPSPDAIAVSLNHLRKNNLISDTPPSKPPPPAIDFTLPRLQGPTISHHFHSIAAEVAEPYLSLAHGYVKTSLPPMPDKDRWVFVPGWTKYSLDGSCESVEYPSEDDHAVVFDVETLPYRGGSFPVMAVALGQRGWYGWCSPWLTGDDSEPNHLIPFSKAEAAAAPDGAETLFESRDSKPRLLIGHHVLFDRARVASEYTLRRPATRWLDTLSLHVAVAGLTSPQRPAWLQHRKEKKEAEEAAAEEKRKKRVKGATAAPPPPPKPAAPLIKSWKEVASINSLVEVARLHCGTKVDKALRDVFIDPATTIEDVRLHFSELMAYCASDVQITSDVFRVLLPKFVATCPHPASFAGVALMSQPILPVDRRWPQYIERAESTYEERSLGVRIALKALAEEARAKMDLKGPDGRYVWEDDLWLRQLDWSPKRARRLPGAVPAKKRVVVSSSPEASPIPVVPIWRASLRHNELGVPVIGFTSPLAALLLRTTWRSYPIVHTQSHGYLFLVSGRKKFTPGPGEELVTEAELGPGDDRARNLKKGAKLYTVPHGNARGFTRTLLSRNVARQVQGGSLSSADDEVLQLGITLGAKAADQDPLIANVLRRLAQAALETDPTALKKDPWLRQLDWTPLPPAPGVKSATPAAPAAPVAPVEEPSPPPALDENILVWPKWYWDLDVPGLGLDVSIKQRAAPLLLKLRWKGFPVVYSKEFGWTFRIPRSDVEHFLLADQSVTPLKFTNVADTSLLEDSLEDAIYVKLPHPDGDGLNVGSPLSKPFVAAFEAETLTSEFAAAADALALNASCSYWTSARERITNQMVVWDGHAKGPVPTPAAIAASPALEHAQGLILPQVIPMGTVTRRAVEKTWLTASNAKKNRVGSELKSMVRAPEGYAIVGADVDSEELWICSVMGDAQFGIHGATAIGWMTLEGTKSAGTDLHSTSAKPLEISRDQAKVFNYSRIYGAGMKHGIQLLLKCNPNLTLVEATEKVKKLYAQTKGLTDRSHAFRRTFWHGGTESFVFNKLEQIAHSDRPRTPALGCGLTDALKKQHLPADGRDKAGEGYMPSRINWVVQSSGVDYLHLLLVSMEYLTKRFGIDARYMISVHDEIRYLVKEEDKYRAAMALQISNVWARTLFSYRLQIGDLPQSCAFFSAVDVDHCFRKEVNMDCVTPSNPDAIPFGESIDIADCLAATAHGSLFADQRSMVHEADLPTLAVPSGLTGDDIRGETHRVDGTPFLVAQTLETTKEVIELWNSVKSSNRSSYGSSIRAAKPSPSPQRPLDFAKNPYIEPRADDWFPMDEDSTREDEDDVSVPAPKPRRVRLGDSLASSAPALVEEPEVPGELEEELFTDTAASTFRTFV